MGLIPVATKTHLFVRKVTVDEEYVLFSPVSSSLLDSLLDSPGDVSKSRDLSFFLMFLWFPQKHAVCNGQRSAECV